MSLFSEDIVKNGTAVIHNYDFNWRKGDMTRRLDEALGLTEQSLKRALRNQISFQWLHEDVLAENLTLDKKYERVNVIKDLQEVMKEVRRYEKIMNEIIVKIDQSEVSSLKRLQWSVGTNPRLKTVHQSVIQEL